MAEDAPLRRAIVVSVLALALVLAGCGGDEADREPVTPAASGPLLVDGAGDEAQLAARRDAFQALDEDAQHQSSDVSGALERDSH
jgi:ABC-type uncharacterized transport system auxiliary subunit